MKRIIFLLFIFLSSYSYGVPTSGTQDRVDEFEDFHGEEDPPEGREDPEIEIPIQITPSKKPLKSRPSAKEAEGSKAPNRFETGIDKSYYRRENGEPFEVDPD